MAFVVPAPQVPSVPVAGGGEFPVRRIFCVGRNYAAHAREMGHDPDREPPFFFSKPADAVFASGGELPYPAMTEDLHHEVELVAALGGGGRDLTPEQALGAVFGYAVGVDLTRRDLQTEAKKAARPWDMAKGFDHSAPCGAITPAAQAGDVAKAAIRLTVNGESRQSSTVADLIWPIPELLAHLSRYVELKAGDLVYTGTPDGVAALKPGDAVVAHVDGLQELTFEIGARA
jgi:fumarylpyruvate hydrolase